MSANPRYPSEAGLLQRAIEGDEVPAIEDVLHYLASHNANLHQMMQTCLHEVPGPGHWQALLECLAAGAAALPVRAQFSSGLAGRLLEYRQPPRGSKIERPLDLERLEASITEAFTHDESAEEGGVKDRLLRQAIFSESTRPAAACLLGRRGAAEVIPLLEELVFAQAQKTAAGVKLGAWALRAVEVLGALPDERCGPPLVRAMAFERGALHQAAKHALNNLGRRAERAWLEALHHSDAHMRWHAACGLSALGLADLDEMPDVLDNLAAGLCDPVEQVRWASGRALVQLDAAAVPAILRLITGQPLTETLRQTVYHVLHSLPSAHTRQRLEALLAALHTPGGGLEAPGMAQRLLREWE